ncbi:TPA: hypothetical protein K8N11_002705, partial [Clostridium perfringens]|nr:hypothetical protein [Clostridium perfringens]
MEKIERGAKGYLEINSIRLELEEIHTNKIDNKWFLKAKYEYNTDNIDFIKNIENKLINIYIC